MENNLIKIVYAIIFALAVVFGAGEYFSDIPTEWDNNSEIIIEKVVDGDTIWVSVDGQTEKIRLIGIDTPETNDPRKKVECFGQEAKTRLKEFEGKSVTLEKDTSQSNKDKYGRSLRYVWVDGVNLNLLMLNEGLAYEYTYDEPYKYQMEFKNAEEKAESEKRGLWGPDACDGKR
jgi:micrococcal nuclease